MNGQHVGYSILLSVNGVWYAPEHHTDRDLAVLTARYMQGRDGSRQAQVREISHEEARRVAAARNAA